MPILTPEERLGTVLGGRYELHRILGSGGMGVVFDGVHAFTGRPVAVKVLRPQFVSEPEIVERFFREARAAASLAHPNIIQVLDMGEADDGSAYLVLERLEGHPLSAFMNGSDRADRAWVLDVLLPVMDALHAAHLKGVVHRDLKPDNIFVAHDALGELVPKVLDFGIAKLTDTDAKHVTATGVIVGTPAYMAPEQAAGKREIGAAADIWSIGMVGLEALSGMHPVEEESSAAMLVRIITKGAPPAAEWCPDLHPSLCAVLDRALAHPPADRWESMEAFALALYDASAEAGIPSRYVPYPRRAAAKSGGHPSVSPGERRQPYSQGRGFRPTAVSDTEPPASMPGAAPTVPAAAAPAPRASSVGNSYVGSRFDPAQRRSVTAVRPYRDAIRERVFQQLERAGLVIEPESVIPVGTSDEDALDAVIASANDILLVPFHGHRDASGKRVDGLSFIELLDARVGGHFRWRVIMPASSFAAAAMSLAMSNSSRLREELKRAIFVIHEEDLDGDDLFMRIGEHVSAA
jgi:serine/threonine protein kinase